MEAAKVAARQQLNADYESEVSKIPHLDDFLGHYDVKPKGKVPTKGELQALVKAIRDKHRPSSGPSKKVTIGDPPFMITLGSGINKPEYPAFVANILSHHPTLLGRNGAGISMGEA